MMDPIFNPELVQTTVATLLNMRGHADLDQSVECCGLLGGQRVGRRVWVVQVEPTINTLRSAVRFEADPADMFRVLRLFREKGLQWVGTYHSHPHAAPKPSKIDIERRQGGGMIDLILGRAPILKADFGQSEPGDNKSPTAPAERKWFLQAWDLSGDEPRLLKVNCDGWADPVESVDLSLYSV